MIDPRINLLVHDVARHRGALFNKLMEPHNLTRAQSWAIGVLSRKGGITQTELAAAMNFTRAAAGALISRLEAAGWVERRSDEQDARVKRVYLTARCRPIRRLTDVAAEEVNRVAFDGFSGAEAQKLIELLERMRANLEQHEADAGEAALEEEEEPMPVNTRGGRGGPRGSTRKG